MVSDTTFSRATAADVEAFYSGPPRSSMRGWVAKHGDAVVAIGGVYYEGFRAIAFSEMSEAFRASRKDVARGCRILMQLISGISGPVYAVADPREPTSEALLRKLGWEPTGRNTPLGELLIRS